MQSCSHTEKIGQIELSRETLLVTNSLNFHYRFIRAQTFLISNNKLQFSKFPVKKRKTNVASPTQLSPAHPP